MKQAICCVAGRSGGHILPCLSYAQTLLQHDSDQKVLFFSSNTKLDTTLGKDSKIVSQQIALPLENIVLKKWWRLPLVFWRFVLSFFASIHFLRTYKPALVISTGGFIAVPVCLAAYLCRIRIELFELNVLPGKATKFLARIASVVRLCFAESKQHLPGGAKCVINDYPLRAECKLPQVSKEITLKALDLSLHKKTILVLGGSQGSESINALMLKIFKNQETFNRKVQVIHQAGKSDPELIKDGYRACKIQSKVFTFDNHIEQLYPAADLVICRSGAGTLFETLHFKKPCITIPLEAFTTTHQVNNAQSFSQQHSELFNMLHQKDLDANPQILLTAVQEQLGIN